MDERTALINAEAELSAIRRDMAALHDSHGRRCKFGIAGGVLYKSWWIFSGVQRAMYGENRAQVCHYVITKCESLKAIHDTAFGLVHISNTRVQSLTLLAACKKLAGEWLEGVPTLEAEYLGDNTVTTSIEEIRRLLFHVMQSVIE